MLTARETVVSCRLCPPGAVAATRFSLPARELGARAALGRRSRRQSPGEAVKPGRSRPAQRAWVLGGGDSLCPRGDSLAGLTFSETECLKKNQVKFMRLRRKKCLVVSQPDSHS